MLRKILLFLVTLLFVETCNGKSILMMVKENAQDNKALNDVPLDAGKQNENGVVIDQIVEDIGNLGLSDLGIAPPKHLDAVKFGRDGNINSKYHKEVFLGEEVKKFENGDYELKEQKSQLIKIFKMIDENGDGQLDENELSKWVLHKTKEHFEEAKLASEHKFNELDNDKDGSVSWNEYLVEFLGRRNFNRQEVAQKLHDKVKIEVDKKLREEIDDAHDKWLQATSLKLMQNKENASRDGDPDMSVAEFRDFQHPETGREMLEYLVQEFLHDMDTDGDEVLTVQEYISVGSDVDVDTQDDDWAKERRTEFRNVIDQNSDGKVTKAELKRYLDPLSEGMAQQEARQLIGFGDENTDFKLSLSELLENSEYYTGSKLYNYARSVHDDL